MSISNDFKNVTLKFNQDKPYTIKVRDKINKLVEQSGKSKVDLIFDAIMDYELNSREKEIAKIKEMIEDNRTDFSNQLKDSMMEIMKILSTYNNGREYYMPHQPIRVHQAQQQQQQQSLQLVEEKRDLEGVLGEVQKYEKNLKKRTIKVEEDNIRVLIEFGKE